MRLAIVIPCYNEEQVLPETVKRLTGVLNELIAQDEIAADSFMLLVNDGSRDCTWPMIQRYHEENGLVKGVNLAGNVGHQNALMAGLMTAKDYADALISIDADLQDDISVIA